MRATAGWTLFAMSFLYFGCTATAADTPRAFLEEFVIGRYKLIGLASDGEATYHGQMEIFRSGDGLAIRRRIGDTERRGTAAIETATADHIKLLRVRFRDESEQYEETCTIGSDLDNEARITCYLYHARGHDAQPGLEALFSEANLRQRKAGRAR